MTRSRLGLMGLCAVIFGVMAMSTASAQAFSWLVLNAAGTVATEVKKEGETVNLLVPLAGKKDSEHLTLLAETLGVPINITCTSFTLVGVNLEPLGKLSNGKVKFEGCEAYKKAPLTEPLGCHVHTGTGPEKVIETTEGKGELVLHEGNVVLTKIEPVGTEFVKILTSGCSLPESNKISGVLYLKDCLGKALTHEVEHLVEQGPLTSLVYGAHSVEHLKTSLDGSGWIKLSGEPHTGLKWAAML